MIRQATVSRDSRNGIGRRQFGLLILASVMGIALPGCVSGRYMMPGRQRDPMAGAPKLPSGSDAALEEIVTHLNKNTSRIQSWRANNVTIRANKMSVPLSAKLAVERGNHVRLIVSSPLGNEVDLGSNDERFWVWSRHMDPAFVTCKHENMDVAQKELGVPFEPEWLMEALGISPIPTTGVTMETDPRNKQVRLIQPVVTAHGLPLRKVVLVNIVKGRGIVVEHSLYDYDSKRVALAKLSGHRPDTATGIVLPHRVVLDWPQNQMSMTMDLGKVQINPSSIPSKIWEMPDLPGYDLVNLDEGVPPARIVIQSKPGAHLGPIEESPSEDDDDQTLRRSANAAGHSSVSNISDADENESDPPRWAK